MELHTIPFPQVKSTSAQPWIGYCTNVHAGTDLQNAIQNLENYSFRVRDLVGQSVAEAGGEQMAPLGIGWWLAEEGAQQALQQLTRLRAWFEQNRLEVRTMNGFPQSNFHAGVVKRRVYLPTWWDESRYHYTANLIQILAGLLPEEGVGSISTLPIGWGNPLPSEEQYSMAATQLSRIAEDLERLFEASGKRIVLAIEPEPGCALGDSATLRDYFTKYLLNDRTADRHQRYLTVCHDVCHAAVMREDQSHELQAYRDLGMAIGKVQVSSAIQIDWDALPPDKRKAALDRLQLFAEDRYLHQTTTSEANDGSLRFFEDLPELLSQATVESVQGSWRIHFHVPIFASAFGEIRSTQKEIEACVVELANADEAFFTGHWEVETYAWSVLPDTLAGTDLAEGIAKEVVWFQALLKSYRTADVLPR